MSIIQDVESHIATALAQTKPRAVMVPLSNDRGWYLFAVYHVKQGKRAGRKTDFGGCYRLEGLFIEEYVAPASGVIAVVSSIREFVCDQLCEYMDELAWGMGAIRQLLVTDGNIWIAFVRDENERFIVREEFTSPSISTESQEPAALGRYGLDLALMNEKIKRSLLPWNEIDNPEVLAKLAVSHVTSIFLGPGQDAPLSLLDEFINSLESDLGVILYGHNRRDTAAHLLASIAVLERISAAISCDIPSVSTLPAGLLQYVERIQPEKMDFHIAPFQLIARYLAWDLSPRRITEFCGAFWNELPNGGIAWDAISSLPDEIANAHIDFLRSRLAAEMPLFEGFDDKRIAWLDPHAGTGSLFVSALYGGNGGPGVQGSATAIESSPLKFCLLRLRVAAALADLLRSGKELPSVRLLPANPLVKPEILSTLPESPLYVIAADLRVFEEKHVRIEGNPDLLEKYKRELRDVWDMSALNEQDVFTQYAALMEFFLQGKKHAAGLFFTPRAWLDNDIFAATRMSWGDVGDRMYVTMLPEDFNTLKRVQKMGLVSAMILRLRGGEGLVAYGLDIRYNEDIAIGMAKEEGYQVLTPTKENHFFLSPLSVSQGYLEWPSLLELALIPPASGPAERRGMALLDIDRGALVERMRDYFSPMSDEELRFIHPSLMPKSRGRGGKSFNAEKVRKALLRHFRFDESRIVPYPSRPFDHLWAYLENLRPLFKEPSPELQELRDIPGNAFLLVRDPNERAATGIAAWFSPYICDYDFFAGNSRQFPMYVDAVMLEEAKSKRRRGAQKLLTNSNPVPNLSPRAVGYLEQITPAIRNYEDEALAKKAELGEAPEQGLSARENIDEMLWYHILAVLFTPAYNRENEEALRRDWPRIPIPYWHHPDELRYNASVSRHFPHAGRQIAQLLSMQPLEINDWPALTSVAVFTVKDGIVSEKPDLNLSDKWAIRTKVNAVRPGKGDAHERDYSAKERDELTEALAVFDIAGTEMEEVFGKKTVDVFLNDGIYWRGVPKVVWEFEVGGHKVLRKWLSYRAESIIKRQLTHEECDVFTDIAQRVTLLIGLGLRLDYLWPRLKDEARR